MRKDNKIIRETLRSWGAYKRRSLGALGFPKSCPAFDPENYEYIYGSEPNWNRKRILPQDEPRYRTGKQQSTRPDMKPRIPNYIGNHSMNYVDNIISGLPKNYQQIATMKFVEELKNEEIAKEINRTCKLVEARISNLYRRLNDEIDRSMLRNHN